MPDLADEFEVIVRLASMPDLQVPICSLCGNHGRIRLQMPTPLYGFAKGFEAPMVDQPCICSNGRHLKARANHATKLQS